MTISTPPAIPVPQPRQSRENPEARIAMLRAEFEALSDRHRQAWLTYEIGGILEREMGNEALAVKEYLASYNLDSAFRPPLFALIRILERRRSLKNLERLYETAARVAVTPEEKASAMVDLATLLEDHLGQPGEARKLYEQALMQDPTCIESALMLEMQALASGDIDAVTQAISARAEYLQEPMLKALLLSELASAKEQAGNIDEAMENLRKASSLSREPERFLIQLEKLARKHRRTSEEISSVTARADLFSDIARSEQANDAVRKHSADKATALWYEAGRSMLYVLNHPAEALAHFERAIEFRPHDVLLQQEHMLAAELSGDVEGAAHDARALLARGASGRFAATLHYRTAKHAWERGNTPETMDALRSALEADPESAAAVGMLEDSLIDLKQYDELVQFLETRASKLSDHAKSQVLWRAAQIASDRVADFKRASRLYRDAVEHATEKAPILREYYGAAIRHQAYQEARYAAQELLAHDIDDDEKNILLWELHALERQHLKDLDSSNKRLELALETRSSSAWAADAARLYAALDRHYPLLAKAHLVLAERFTDRELTAAHRCAAARAYLHAGQQDEAMASLRAALEEVPGHPYAVALLESVLRSRGDSQDLIALLRQTAEAQDSSQGAEASLLMAGAAAEGAGDLALAVRTYEQAADREPTSISPLLSLRRLAERAKNSDLLLRVCEAISERELTAGAPGLATLELGERYDLIAGKPELAERPLRSLLEDPQLGTAAALSLLLMPERGLDPQVRAAAAEQLFAQASENDRPAWLRLLIDVCTCRGGDWEKAEGAAEELANITGQDAGLEYSRLRIFSHQNGRHKERADAWYALANATNDKDASADLMLHALRTKMWAFGAEAAEDAFLLAQDLDSNAPDAAVTAVALDETLTGGDDPDARAEALQKRLAHAGTDGKSSIEAAYGRALVAAGHSTDAAEKLSTLVERDPWDLSSWEALRVAAREAEDWDKVVQACDQLSAATDGESRAQLLEEAAVVLEDQLGVEVEAELRLRDALDIDVCRTIAYGRLHDMLSDRQDTKGLLSLVTRRVEKERRGEELEKLLYEQARLRRSEGDREGALGTLQVLFEAQPLHVGGLALAVEVHVSLEQWANAVQSLRRLAEADVTPAQQRVALLGAADFLISKLGDPSGAIEVLERVEQMGLADATVFSKMADAAELAGEFEVAVEQLKRASRASQGDARAHYERKAATLQAQKMGDVSAAISTYRRALAEVPTDHVAAESLAALVSSPAERRVIADSFEVAVRAQLTTTPSNPDILRKLGRAATWRDDRDLQFLVLNTLVALRIATPDEQSLHDELIAGAPWHPRGQLDTHSLDSLYAPGGRGIYGDLAHLAYETIAHLDRLEPGTYGVSKSDLVSTKQHHPLAEEVFSIAEVFGLERGDFYIGGTDPTLIAVVPGKKGKPTWIFGSDIETPLSAARRFVIGQLSMASRTETLPIVQRKPAEGAIVLLAVAAASEAPLPTGLGKERVSKYAMALAKTLPRKTKKSVREMISSITDGGAGLEPWCVSTHRTALRAGLLMAGDIRVAFETILGPGATYDRIRQSQEARELLLFWTSPRFLSLRLDLGLSL